MKKVFKIFSLLMVTLLTSLTVYTNANAATATISVLSSSSQVLVGKTFKITVKISSTVPLGSWDYTLNYDSSLASLVKSDVPLRYAAYGDGVLKTKSYTYTFKALKSGKAKFYVSNTAVIDWDFGVMSVTNGSRTVTFITQAQLEASYSKNNDLKALEVEGYDLVPEFSSDVTTYDVSLSSEITSITIDATRDDKTATVTGTGEFPVSEGLNVFTIDVKAQNGDVKTYTLNVNVEDKNPINVTYNDLNYTVVKRKDLLPIPTTFAETIITINELEIPGFYSEALDYTLVGLKNPDGEVSLFIYNADTNEYTPYYEVTLNNIVFTPLTTTKEIEDYEKTTILINSVEVEAYKLTDTSDYSIVYGRNVETGNTGFYLYDKEENTLQRYDNEQVILLKEDIKDYMLIILIFGSGLGLSIIYIIYSLIKKSKKHSKKEEPEIKETKKKNSKKEQKD
ncbi:MAG TPA: cadherin-like beta sandwich domain-containing protein [Bacilli bacterium]|nr:cadherin-like beta sandwich domain-containing protein [Bacilli bacterium]